MEHGTQCYVTNLTRTYVRVSQASFSNFHKIIFFPLLRMYVPLICILFSENILWYFFLRNPGSHPIKAVYTAVSPQSLLFSQFCPVDQNYSRDLIYESFSEMQLWIIRDEDRGKQKTNCASRRSSAALRRHRLLQLKVD
jgi:hypothetical protein